MNTDISKTRAWPHAVLALLAFIFQAGPTNAQDCKSARILCQQPAFKTWQIQSKECWSPDRPTSNQIRCGQDLSNWLQSARNGFGAQAQSADSQSKLERTQFSNAYLTAQRQFEFLLSTNVTLRTQPEEVEDEILKITKRALSGSSQTIAIIYRGADNAFGSQVMTYARTFLNIENAKKIDNAVQAAKHLPDCSVSATNGCSEIVLIEQELRQQAQRQ